MSPSNSEEDDDVSDLSLSASKMNTVLLQKEYSKAFNTPTSLYGGNKNTKLSMLDDFKRRMSK